MVPEVEEAAMSDNLKFQPPGPYALPAAQSATASALSDAVEVRITAFVDGNPDTLVIQMTAGTAMELAAQLMDAAVKAKKT
jgi:siroheme synthase